MQLYHNFIADLSFATSTLSVKVDVYDGPKEYEDSEIVKNGQQLTMEYTWSIDQSSTTDLFTQVTKHVFRCFTYAMRVYIGNARTNDEYGQG